MSEYQQLNLSCLASGMKGDNGTNLNQGPNCLTLMIYLKGYLEKARSQKRTDYPACKEFIVSA